MSGLPSLMRADCGHGFIPVDTKPSAVDHAGNELHLCAACTSQLRAPETKDVKATQQRIAGR